MTRGRARVHFDATRQGDRVRRALCGWLQVDCSGDLTQVTCKVCLTQFAEGRRDAVERKSSPQPKDDELQAVLSRALAPKAGPPPRLTPATWAASCRGGEHRRCGDCAICAHENDLAMWAFAAPDRYLQQPLQRLENAPLWSSVDAALRAWAEGSPPAIRSFLGGMIDRKESGHELGAFGSPRESPAIRRGLDLLPIDRALLKAYPLGGHAKLSHNDCREALLLRTPGCAEILHGPKAWPSRPTYEQLGERYSVDVGEVEAVVRTGRRLVAKELCAIGLIPTSRERRERVEGEQVMRVDVEGVGDGVH